MKEAKLDHLVRRSLVYRLLSRAFREEPDAEFLVAVNADGMNSLLHAISCQLDTTAFRIAGETCLEELAVEFCRLFVGPEVLVAPYESVHRNESGNSGQLWGDSTVEVNNLVESLGLCYSADRFPLPDHISVEFELMCRLLDAEALAHRKADTASVTTAFEIQDVFFNEHIKVWVPSFCERLQATTSSPFYSAMSVLTSDFVSQETEEYARRRASLLSN